MTDYAFLEGLSWTLNVFVFRHLYIVLLHRKRINHLASLSADNVAASDYLSTLSLEERHKIYAEGTTADDVLENIRGYEEAVKTVKTFNTLKAAFDLLTWKPSSIIKRFDPKPLTFKKRETNNGNKNNQ